MNEKSLVTSNLEDALIRGEYEAQFFDSAIICLTHSIKQVIRSHLETCLESMKESFGKRCDDKQLLDGALRNVSDKLYFVVDEHCKEMETKLFEIFNIPSHVLLPEDKIQQQQYTESDEQELDKEINNLKLQYEKACFKEMILKDEKKANKNIDNVLKTWLMIEKEVQNVKEGFEIHEKCFDQLQKQYNGIQELRNLGNFLFKS